MRKAMTFLFAFVMLTSCFGQSTSTKWQVATIMNIKSYPPAAEDNAPAGRHYVTVRVENTEYVVLYVPPDATQKDVVEYHPGMDGLVLLGADSMKYNDMLGRTREVPIISRRTIPAKVREKKPDNKD